LFLFICNTNPTAAKVIQNGANVQADSLSQPKVIQEPVAPPNPIETKEPEGPTEVIVEGKAGLGDQISPKEPEVAIEQPGTKLEQMERTDPQVKAAVDVLRKAGVLDEVTLKDPVMSARSLDANGEQICVHVPDL